MSPDSGAPVVDVDRIDAFHKLLSTLTGALDIPESLHRLSDIWGRIVPHDEFRLVLLNEGTGAYERYACPDQPEALRPGEDQPLDVPAVPALLLDEPDRNRGFCDAGILDGLSGFAVPHRFVDFREEVG